VHEHAPPREAAAAERTASGRQLHVSAIDFPHVIITQLFEYVDLLQHGYNGQAVIAGLL
jgi:hypothetical protein